MFDLSGARFIAPLETLPVEMLVLLLIAMIAETTVHEFGHGWMANRLGDPTPREQGRLTLNPFKHLDPLGFVLMAVTLWAGFPLGWGKPVKTDPSKFCCGARRGMALVALAGPLANLILAIALAPLVRLLLSGILPPSYVTLYLLLFFYLTLGINVSFFVLNLIPVHPLDGAHILNGVLPEKWATRYRETIQPLGIYLLLGLSVTGILGKFLAPIIIFLIKLLTGI